MPSFADQPIRRLHWHASRAKVTDTEQKYNIKAAHAQGSELLELGIHQRAAVLVHRGSRRCQEGVTTSCPHSLRRGRMHMQTF